MPGNNEACEACGKGPCLELLERSLVHELLADGWNPSEIRILSKLGAQVCLKEDDGAAAAAKVHISMSLPVENMESGIPVIPHFPKWDRRHDTLHFWLGLDSQDRPGL